MGQLPCIRRCAVTAKPERGPPPTMLLDVYQQASGHLDRHSPRCPRRVCRKKLAHSAESMGPHRENQDFPAASCAKAWQLLVQCRHGAMREARFPLSQASPH
jgi:hypothetical protein